MSRRSVQAKSIQQRTIRATILFVVFVCVSLLAVDAWLAWRVREQQLRQAVVSNTNLAASVAQQVNGMVSEVGHLLDSIAFELQTGAADERELNHLQPILKNHADSNQHVHGLFVYDAQGAWLINSHGVLPPGANNADREYFIHHRDHPSLATRVGKPIVSRLTGIWVIPVSRRFNDARGQFAGVLLATIDLKHVRRMLDHFQIGDNGSLSVALASTAILVRRPFSEKNLGKEIPPSALKEQLTSQTSGNFEFASPVDGIQRIGSFRYTDSHSLMVAVAQSKHELLGNWRETTWIQTFWIFLLCVVTALAGSLVVQLVRQRVKVEFDLSDTRDKLTKANERLALLANLDGLTGLANRRSFDETLERDFDESCRSGQPLSLVMIDVDHFKQYNDLHGHPEGDRCLQQVATAIESTARRPLDFVARYGGEEMVMLLPQTDAAGALVVAELARSAVEALQLPHSDRPLRKVSISVGVASHTLNDIHENMQSLVKHADEALYQAKAVGRNRVVAYRDK